MMNWKTYKLSEVAQIIKDGYKPTASDELHYIGLEHIEQQSLRLGGIGKSSDVTSGKFKFNAGDILFGKLRPYFRKVYRPQFDGVCSTDIWVVRAKKNFDQGFLFYFLASQEFIDLTMQGSSGTRMPRADWNVLKDKEFSFPDLPTQRRIAEILSALDDKIELNRRMNQTLEQMAQTLFRQYFVDGIDEEILPEGWAKKSLGELVDITSSKRIFLNEYVPEGVPFYRGKEIIQLNKTGIISTELFITEEKFGTIKSKFGVPKEGDILLTSVGTIGVPYLVNKDDVFYFKDGNITWIKSYLDHVGPVYLYQWLISEVGQSSIDNITIGSTQKAVTIQSLKSMQVIVPPKELHDSVCNQLQALRDKINHNIKEIRTLIQTRDSLLPKLMSGEIDVMQTKPEELYEAVLS